jgi:hypothetical protein
MNNQQQLSGSITGTIHSVSQLTQIGNKNTDKCTVVIEAVDNPMYPQYIPIEAIGQTAGIAASFKKGDVVHVKYNVRGRLWNPPTGGDEKCFLSFSLYDMGIAGQMTATQAMQAQPQQQTQQGADGDDLPF